MQKPLGLLLAVALIVGSSSASQDRDAASRATETYTREQAVMQQIATTLGLNMSNSDHCAWTSIGNMTVNCERSASRAPCMVIGFETPELADPDDNPDPEGGDTDDGDDEQTTPAPTGSGTGAGSAPTPTPDDDDDDDRRWTSEDTPTPPLRRAPTCDPTSAANYIPAAIGGLIGLKEMTFRHEGHHPFPSHSPDRTRSDPAAKHQSQRADASRVLQSECPTGAQSSIHYHEWLYTFVIV